MRKNHLQWKSIITFKEEYLNVLKEFPELPTIGELDVILADGEIILGLVYD